ncbi:UvrD-helicase domain-containing protein [Maricaulis sp.]|uniref:UvrD-helicase domain-containing protein n=1 Tax=Maricaulis sp. TaxID=1486257 RepID=UPI003A919880
MNFLLASSFSDSLMRLTGQEQKAVKQTAFDLQLDPSGGGKSFHRIDRSADPNFWSVRVTRDIRLIVHKTASSLMLCHVDHHDKAYAWAERRKIERHPTTGAAQLVELRETVREIEIVRDVPVAPVAMPPLFADRSEAELLALGVPPDWLAAVQTANEETLLDLADHLPQEAAEALLELAYGTAPAPTPPAAAQDDMFAHPDALRRFRVLANVEELTQALDYPWEKWTVFLHPAQRAFARRSYNGPARVSGSAGTGKTVVALHRAVFLAETSASDRVLLTTFSKALASALKTKLAHLAGHRPDMMSRIDVLPIDQVGLSLHEARLGGANIATRRQIQAMLDVAARDRQESRFSSAFLWMEWNEVVDAWSLRSWEAYRDVPRLGRKTRLGEQQRRALWEIFEETRRQLDEQGLTSWSQVFEAVTAEVAGSGWKPYRHVVVDEAQDLAIPQLRFLAALAGEVPDGLFFAGDLGQRIFQQPFSWRSLGVDIRGRSHTLKVNYRTSHQIRSKADRLQPGRIGDVDGNIEDRRGAVSIFNGPLPVVALFDDEGAEASAVSGWICQRFAEGLAPEEIGIIVRSADQIGRARAAVADAGLRGTELDDAVEIETGHVAISTMHWAKGLEFRAACVMACDDEVIPLQSRVEAVGDVADLDDVLDTERHLLYVACTRARDHLMVSGVHPGSEFLEDMG